jgi:endonuclease/exonuclease/phosphatase family metal-dependent hydrolase
MRIGTYNVLGLRGFPPEEAQKEVGEPGGEKGIEHFAGVFASLECDVLALEEGVSVRQMQEIARRMDCHLATIPSPIAWPGHLLSRYPILESRVFSHTVPGGETPLLSRTGGSVLLQLEDEIRLWVVVVHLHPASEEMRDREADIIWKRLGELLSVCENAVVVGDFNCAVEERLHSHLRSMEFVNAMEEVGGGIEWTMDTVGVNQHAVDHIYLSPSLKQTLKGARVVSDSGFRHDGPQAAGVWVHSDHLPVVADLELSKM